MTAFQYAHHDDAHLLSIFIDHTPDIDTLRAEAGLIIGSDERDDSQIIAMRGNPGE